VKNLFNLLERLSNSLNKDSLVKQEIAQVIKDRTRVTLEPEKLVLKDGVLELQAGATAKNEIMFKEAQIKDELKFKGITVARILYK
jgi:hypothetical protein